MPDARHHVSRPSQPRVVRRRITGTAIVRGLNDPRRGALLDALLQARFRLAAAAPSSWEAETLAALAEGVLERLAALGIRPLRTVGERLVLGARQLAGRFEYHGTPFRTGERRKHVVVATPGWAVGRRTVVRPAVREAAPEERR